VTDTVKRLPDENIAWRTSVPFIIVNLLPLGVIFTGITWPAFWIFLTYFWVRLFFLTGVYHRYFSHRAYRLNRFWQFWFAFGGATSAQKGPLWWASHHRDHHRYADTDRDPHTPARGFWWSHVGWILSSKYKETDLDRISDFARYPEIRWLEKHDWIAPWSLAITAYLIAGLPGLFFGFFFSTVLLWHTTFCINSVAHLQGRRRYATDDTSRNNPVLAVMTLGEGWHNNHHHYPASCRQGFNWWEIDVTYYVLRGLSFFGIVRELRTPPVRARQSRRLRQGHLDLGTLRLQLDRASATIGHVRQLRDDELARLQQAVSDLSERARTAAAQARRISTSPPRASSPTS
jgi:stearoyl-CoA desaturase (delta-9 desaturase)